MSFKIYLILCILPLFLASLPYSAHAAVLSVPCTNDTHCRAKGDLSATCVTNGTNHSCNCSTGWTGSICDVKQSSAFTCTTNNDCRNGQDALAVCDTTTGTCKCSFFFFHGAQCQLDYVTLAVFIAGGSLLLINILQIVICCCCCCHRCRKGRKGKQAQAQGPREGEGEGEGKEPLASHSAHSDAELGEVTEPIESPRQEAKSALHLTIARSQSRSNYPAPLTAVPHPSMLGTPPASAHQVPVEELVHGILVEHNDIHLLRRIGRGAFGEVWTCYWQDAHLAVKKLLPGPHIDLNRAMQEVLLLSSIRHPNVLSLYGVCMQPELCILTEFCAHGSLDAILYQSTMGLSMPLRVRMALHCAAGLNALHRRNIMHRDIKSMNMLVTADMTCKVADFGLARYSQDGQISTMTQCGTPCWTAPEILRGDKTYTTKADVYSYGIMLFEIFARRMPYQDVPPMSVSVQVVTKSLRPVIPENVPSDLASLIQRCWAQDPLMRPDFSEIIRILQSHELMEEQRAIHEHARQ